MPAGSDIPTREYIISLNARAPDKGKFLLTELDDTHLFVKSEMVPWLREQLQAYQKQITYERSAEGPRRE